MYSQMLFQCLNVLSLIWISSLLVSPVSRVDSTSDEEAFIRVHGSNPNTSGKWELAKELHVDYDALLDLCRQVHEKGKKHPGEMMLAAYCTRKLEFSEKYEPIGIDMIFYLLRPEELHDGETLHFNFTKGLKPDCVFYLKGNDDLKSRFYTLDQHVCGIQM